MNTHVRLVLFVLVLVFTATVDGRSRNNGSRKEGCKYSRPVYSGCGSDNKRNKTQTLKNYRNTALSCEVEKVKAVDCRKVSQSGCKYEHRQWAKSDCNETSQIASKTLNLVDDPANVDGCDSTYTKEIDCRKLKRKLKKQEKFTEIQEQQKGKKKKRQPKKAKRQQKKAKRQQKKARKQQKKARKQQNKNRKHQKKLQRKGRRKEKRKKRLQKKTRRQKRQGCKYNASEWTACNETTQTASRTMALRKARDGISCNQTWTQTISCRNLEAKLAKRQRNAGRREERRNKLVEREERRQNESRAVCKYTKEDWSDCDLTTDTVSKTLTLISGSEDCEQTISLHRKCSKACKYMKGKWGECDPNTSIRERTDTLNTQVSEQFCENTRKITKKCGKKRRRKNRKGCIYNSGQWGDCDTATGMRTKTKTLKSGDPSKCDIEKTVTKPCANSNGEDRCFFGKWKAWQECRNGVQRKERDVLQGGVACQRKGAKTRPCDSA